MSDAKLFDTLLEPIFILDSASCVTYCNEAAALITELSVRKILRSKPKFRDLIRFQDPIPALLDLASVTEPTPYLEISFTVESGKEGRVQLTIQKFNSDSWIVFFRDVTLEETLQRKYRGELEKKEDVIRALEIAQAKLEDYSRNLEKMVEERTLQLSALNHRMKALLDSLAQGFLIFDAKGICSDVASKACQTILGMDPRNSEIGKVLRFDQKALEKFKKWMATAFDEMLPFEDLAPLAPPRFQHPENREISLTYYPLRNDSGTIEGIVMVATDITDLVVAQREAEKERSFAKMIGQMVRQKKQIQKFFREATELVKEVRTLANQSLPSYDQTFRSLHTLKGGAASFSFHNLVQTAHRAEDLLTEWHEKKSQNSENTLMSLRTTIADLSPQLQEIRNEFANLVGSAVSAGQAVREISGQKLDLFYQELTQTPQLRSTFYDWFLVEPLSEGLAHYNDVIQQIALDQQKSVGPLELEPADFAFWQQPYERLISTFVHAFRNAIDHGIETTADRELLGKSPAGRIGVRCAKTESGQLRIEIWDDGGGIDPVRIRAKLAKNTIDHSNETDEQVIQHVFDSAFSTREQITELSGRGVGMDAIKEEALELGGTVKVQSTVGKGTNVIIEVPWITETSKKAA